jgi:predicted RNase H-like HicB family nuclease
MKKRKIYNYLVIFEKNEFGGYTVLVPALPGLVTEGNDLIEAKKNAEEAIKCYLEGLIKDKAKIPEEKEVAQIRIEVKV